ncbi:hypothetical protein [Marinicrinis lubricantis]|uniref:Uncharacterized protein n=1 Tax=Marinicrinis lubricantis TaxID=2086470 RepID=A0ABW1INK7_9BACL
MNGIGQEPTIVGLNQLDVAILMGKYSILLGMINFGTAKQKTIAKKILKEMESYIYNHINPISFELGNRNLGLNEQELHFIDYALN